MYGLWMYIGVKCTYLINDKDYIVMKKIPYGVSKKGNKVTKEVI